MHRKNRALNSNTIMNVIKKKALLFCVNTIEREVLSSVIQAFSLEVTEVKTVIHVQKMVEEQDVEYVFINEENEQLERVRILLNRQISGRAKFILFRKNLSHLYLKIFNEGENYTRLKIVLDKFILEESPIDSLRNQKGCEFSNSNLLSILSHEIFTPLNSVIGFSQLLKKFDYDETEIKNYSGFIFQSGKEMQKKCLLLLDLIALRAGAIRLNFSHFSIVSLFSEILENHKSEKKLLFINVEYDYDLHDVEIYADKSKIERILERLLDNALKFTEEGSVTFGFTIKKNKSLLLFVKDTGIGISKKNIKYVFEAFWQVDGSDTRKYGGFGIGLHLVKEFVDILDGEIAIESEEGKGTCVQVEIPLHEPDTEEKIRIEEAYFL